MYGENVWGKVNKQTHQYSDSDQPKGRAEWKNMTISLYIFFLIWVGNTKKWEKQERKTISCICEKLENTLSLTYAIPIPISMF